MEDTTHPSGRGQAIAGKILVTIEQAIGNVWTDGVVGTTQFNARLKQTHLDKTHLLIFFKVRLA